MSIDQEGFVYAVSPFNFTAIGGNLCSAPALMGNVVLWKPAPAAMLSNYLVYQILLEAGLPKGVIQFVPGDAVQITKTALSHREFAGLHFTGSSAIFRTLWQQVSAALPTFKSYPRLVGETGGKNMHFVHASADVASAACQTLRGAFEYAGQKCSATSRAYVADTIWPEFKKALLTEYKQIKQGPVENFKHFVGPVIGPASFQKIKTYIDAAKGDPSVEILAGGTCPLFLFSFQPMDPSLSVSD